MDAVMHLIAHKVRFSLTSGLWLYLMKEIEVPVRVAVYNRVGAQVQAPIWEKAP